MSLFAARWLHHRYGANCAMLAWLLAVVLVWPGQGSAQDRSAGSEVPAAASTGSRIPPELRPARPPSNPVVAPRAPNLDDLSVRIHTIQPGESLWSISRRYGMNLNILMETNQISRGKILRPGQQLVVTNVPGLFRKVRAGETLASICADYDIPLADAMKQNQVVDARTVRAGTMLFLPGARARRSSNYFIWPVRGRLSSTFGTRLHPLGGGEKFHAGIVVGALSGRPIVAAQDGRVVLAGRNGSLGLCVILQHQDGYKTVYGHASKLLVKQGMDVKQGEIIALVGRTGQTTGSHLHFEIHRNNRPMDPLPVLPSSKR